MRYHVLSPIVLFGILLVTGCGEAPHAVVEPARKPVDEPVAKVDPAEQARAKEQREAGERVREELKQDNELLLGHWDFPGGKGPDGKTPLAIHLEVTGQSTARFHLVSGLLDSTTECPIQLKNEDGQRSIVLGEGAGSLKFSPLVYRLAPDRLTLKGNADDVLFKTVDISGEWRRTDWTKKTEAEIADTLKKLDAHLDYDENNPANPIVGVAFNFQAPVHNVHLRILAGLKHLQNLDLSEAGNINDAGLKHLAALKELKQLNLSTIPASDEAIQALKRHLPGCNVIH